LVAECLRPLQLVSRFRRKRRSARPVPDERCECGIYAAWLPQIDQYLTDAPTTAINVVGRVLGRVSLWGTVIECERGFRASHAYPQRVYVPVDASLHPKRSWEELVAGLDAYGVPVELLPARCREAVNVLEAKQLTALRQADR
jgi:hypothetical protein